MDKYEISLWENFPDTINGTSFLNEADARTLACFNTNLVTSVRMTGITIPFQPPKRLQLSQ